MDPVGSRGSANMDWPTTLTMPATPAGNGGSPLAASPSSPQSSDPNPARGDGAPLSTAAPALQSAEPSPPITSSVQTTDTPAPKVAKPDAAANGLPSPAEPAAPVANATAKPPMSPNKAAVAIVVAGLLLLLLVGLLLRRIVAMALGGRHEIKVTRQEPRLIGSAKAKASTPTLIRVSPSLVPGQNETNARIREVEDSLRNFARRLQQRRAKPRNVFARMGGWVRS